MHPLSGLQRGFKDVGRTVLFRARFVSVRKLVIDVIGFHPLCQHFHLRVNGRVMVRPEEAALNSLRLHRLKLLDFRRDFLVCSHSTSTSSPSMLSVNASVSGVSNSTMLCV